MLASTLTVAGTLAWASPAEAADDDRGRPWAKGTVVPSFGFGFGYSRDLVALSFGLGASYYLFNGFSLGLQLDDQVLIYSKSLKGDLPDLENQIPTNVFRLTPVAQWVFLRRPRFSPYVFAGVGPVFFNNDNGVHGHWTAGPGAYLGLAGPVWLDIGVGFSGMFPTDACNDSFVYRSESGDSVRVLDYCSFRWGPRLGLVLAFGGGGKKRERESAPDPFATEPAPNPMEEAVPEPEPMPGLEPLPELEPEPEPEPRQPSPESIAPSEPQSPPAPPAPPPDASAADPMPPSPESAQPPAGVDTPPSAADRGAQPPVASPAD